MKLYKKNRNVFFIIVLFLLSFIIRLLYLPNIPLTGDEAVYAEMIDEFIHTPQIVPRFMGHITSWKPPLGFALYSTVVYTFRMLNSNIPLEVAYRLPPIIFGVLSTLSLYFLVKKLYGEELAFLSSFIFTTNVISIIISERLMLETPVLFLLLTGITFYIDGERDKKYFYYAGLCGALLFLTKSIIAFLLPALAIAYYFGNRRIGEDKEAGRAFLISLSAVPLAMLLYALVFFMTAPLGRGADITVSYVYDMFFRVYGKTNQFPLLLNTIEFLKLTLPWSILSFAGLMTIKLSKREDRFLFLWLVLIMVFIGAAQFYNWYYLLILTPFSILCAKPLMQIKDRKFFLHLFLLLFLFSFPYIANPDFIKLHFTTTENTNERVQVGLFLRDKSNILAITEIAIPEAVFYKFHGESSPNYSEFEMKVLEPYAPGSYIAYPTVTELAFGSARSQNITSAQQVISMIFSTSNNAYVVMDSKVYKVYFSSPLQNYSLIFNSSSGSYVVIKRIT